MAEIVQANYESLASVARQFGQEAAKIRQTHSRLNQQMAMLRPTWVGKGSEAFFAEMADKVLPGVLRLSAALAEADRVTKQIEQVLHEAEEQGSSPFNRDRAWAGGGLNGTGVPLDGSGGSSGGGGVGGEGDVGSAGSGGGYAGGIGGSGAGSLVGSLDDFAREYSIENLLSGLGGAWGDDNFLPFDINDALLGQLIQEYGFGDAGGGAGLAEIWGPGDGSENDFAVPQDWLSEVEEAFGSPWDRGADEGDLSGLTNDELSTSGGGSGAAGSGDSGMGSSGDSGMGSGGATGGGATEAGAGGGSDMGAGAGSSNPGSGSGSGGTPAGEMRQFPTGGMASGQGATGANSGTALPGPLRYQTLGGGAIGANTTQATPQTTGSAAAPAAVQPAASQAKLGVPMGLAALGPLVALLGKALKERGSGR